MRGPQTSGDYAVVVVDTQGTETPVVGYVAGQTPSADADIPDIGPQEYVSVKITLSSANASTDTAELSGFQLKSLPGTPHQRILQIPVWVFDSEMDRNGVISGYEGSAEDRLTALEAVDEAGDVVTFQDLDAGTSIPVVIEQISFAQTAPPDGADGFGGIVTLTLRTV
jgi:hypothetical protein